MILGFTGINGQRRKHAQANRIKVQFILDDNLSRISVEDNGKGFTPRRLGKWRIRIKPHPERLACWAERSKLIRLLGKAVNHDSVPTAPLIA